MEIIGFTYTDSWWEVVPNPSSTVVLKDENDNDLPGYENGTLEFLGSATNDSNPWSYAQCQWNQNIQLLDLNINQLISMTGFSNYGGTWMGSWGGSGSDFGSIQFQTQAGLDNCTVSPEMPEMV